MGSCGAFRVSTGRLLSLSLPEQHKTHEGETHERAGGTRPGAPTHAHFRQNFNTSKFNPPDQLTKPVSLVLFQPWRLLGERYKDQRPGTEPGLWGCWESHGDDSIKHHDLKRWKTNFHVNG